MEKLLDMLEYNDLNDSLKILADVSGMDAIKDLFKNHSGERFYIPFVQHIIPLVRRYIAEQIKSNSTIDVKSVSKDLNLSRQYIRILIRESYRSKSNSLTPLNVKAKCTRQDRSHYYKP